MLERMSVAANQNPAPPLDLASAAALSSSESLDRLASDREVGLTTTEAAERLSRFGPNALRTHGVRPWEILLRQLRSYLLLLLLFAAVVSAAVGDGDEALIIGVIMSLSIGLSFVNEFRSEKAVEALHSQIHHLATVDRDGQTRKVDVVELVPGDIVHLRVGDVVPADVRLIEASHLECDESVLTGESQAVLKVVSTAEPGEFPLDLANCAFMGTVVRSGAGRGVVIETGSGSAFGRIALSLGTQSQQTSFQNGLADFSRMLASVTAGLAGSIFLINVALGRSMLESALFALAIAVGLTPQLLPAIVTVSLATGSRRLSQRSVIVKRLVCIEDLGNIRVLFTDKTGTLTDGHIRFQTVVATDRFDDAEARVDANSSDRVLRLGLACSDPSGNELDAALWQAAPADAADAANPLGWKVLASLPFDHERQISTVLAGSPNGNRIITKGAPERVFSRCDSVATEAQATVTELFETGLRVVAVASRPTSSETLTADDEHALQLDGFLCFADPPKENVAQSLQRLDRLGITVKVITGDNGLVAQHLCQQIGLGHGELLTGSATRFDDRRRT